MDVYSIALELTKFPDFEVSFVVGDFGQKKFEKHNLIKVLKSFRTDLKGFSRFLYGAFIAGPKLLSALRKAQADIYFQEGAGYETLLVAIFCRLARKRFVYRIPTRVECTNEALRLWPIMGRAFRFGLKMADAIITQDQDEVNLLKRNLELTSTAIYSTTPIPDKAQLVPTDQRKYILWVSRLVKLKHPEIFLKVAKCFPNEKFILNGPPAPNNMKFDQEIKREASHVPNLIFSQGMKRPELDETYRHAKLFLNTSDVEGFPITFIEAGKYGVPIITLNVDPDNILSKNKFGECAKGSVDFLIKIVGEWLEKESKRDVASKAFRYYVENTNDIHKNVFLYIRLFNNLLLKTPAGFNP